MWGARSELDAVSCGRIAETLVPSSDRLRRIVVVIALVALVAGALSAVGTATASENGAVYVNETGYVEFIDQKGTQNATELPAAVVGTAANVDSDDNIEAPVVTKGGALKLVDPAGQDETLVASGVATAAIAVDNVDGKGTSDVLYVNESNESNIWRVSGDGNSRELLAAVNANAVAGYGDFDGDGTEDVVFVDGTSIRYTNGTSVVKTGYSSVGQNNGVAVGPLANYDDSGGPRVAVVDQNQNVSLVDDGGNGTVLGGSEAVARSPVGKTDLDGDGASEVVYVDVDSDELEVAEAGDDDEPVTSGGSSVTADGAIGAAGGQGIDLTPPPVSVNAPENRTYIQDAKGVPLNVSAEEEVEQWRYSIDGVDKGPFDPNDDDPDTLALDPGEQYNLTVSAEDPDGNVETVERTFGVGRAGSTAVYIDDESGNLSYINASQKMVETSVSRDEENGFVAAGPAIHFDADGQLEIPYVRKGADENNSAPLRLYHVANGSTTELDEDAMGSIDHGKISTADFDDDGRFDVVYRDANGDLKRVDRDTRDVLVANESGDTDPQAIFGSADVVGDADREIVWIDAGTNLKYVSQNSNSVEPLSFDQTPGSNNNVGAGEPLPIVRGGPTYFPIVDGSGNPGVLNASDKSYRQLADANARKAPVGLADVNGDTWKELLFIDDGVVKYTKADPLGAPNEVKQLRIDGGLVEADANIGVVTTHFAQRVNDQYEYPADDPAPNVYIRKPVDTEYEDEVPLEVRAYELIDEWYYSVDGGPETRFDGSQQLLTGLSRGTHTITVRAVDADGDKGRTSETFQVTRADPNEAETQARTATPTPTPTATPTPTSTPTPTATPTPTPTATATSTAASTSTATAVPEEPAGSTQWVYPLLVLAMIAIAVVAVRQMDSEE